ncbi:hypothetical protein [Legionella longbeachae]|uniref:hypothetical protein n=1 Tax=Legionella longbeachae TaxID=450 RepID=UPI0001BEBC8B|nr:hypothetical protein [Legionella longbeachae]EEZ95941.1 conserved hypothetical protein [Legionella longbeachae D-4968]
MSKKTLSQMEEVLTDRIEKAKLKLNRLQQKHKLEIGSLAFKHNLNHYDLKQLDCLFARIAKELCHEHL